MNQAEVIAKLQTISVVARASRPCVAFEQKIPKGTKILRSLRFLL